MSSPYSSDEVRREVRERLQGLGERSARKSYYPALQERLAELERFRALLDEAGEGIFLLAWPSALIVDANGAAARQLGVARAQLVGARLTDHLAPAAVAPFLAAVETAEAGGEQLIVRAELLRAGGEPRAFPAELGLRRVIQDAGTFLVAVARDVTEREQLRALLAVADRMVSIGALAAGVAHEINNPLAYVLGNLDYLRRTLARLRRSGALGPDADADADEAEATAADALEGTERVRQIVRDLKTLSRTGDEVRGVVDLRRVVDVAAAMVAHELRQRAQLVKEYRSDARVVASEGRLTQVLLNLLVNAAQATPEGQVDRNAIRVVVTAGDPGEAVVEVHDTGAGIAPEVLPRIFEPFFTTKPAGVGTGLGLPICRDIVAELGGRIEVESAPGHGSTFRIRLPATGPADVACPAEAEQPALPRARVLVVDDDPRCGKVVERLLGPPHDVTACTSARAALHRIAGGERFDAILCDVMMPDVDGPAFYDLLGELAPDLVRRVIFASAGTFTERTERFLHRTSAPTLEKPFARAALEAALILVLAR